LQPVGIAFDSLGNYYICDTANHCIKQISAGGVVTVLAGKSGSSGTADGTGEAALFSSPTGIAIDTTGSLVVTDTGNSSIRKISSSGAVTTFAGSSGNSGTTDGIGTEARFTMPTGITVSTLSGDIFVADSANSTIRQISIAGVVKTIAGVARSTGDADGIGTAARFNNPTGIALDPAYNLLVADTFNNTIRSITTQRRKVQAIAAGTIVTAGNAVVVVTDSGLTGSPVTINVAVVANDTPTAWAGKVVTALQANTAIAARYTASSTGTDVTLTYLAATDESVIANISLNNGTCTGIVPAPTSTTGAPSATVKTVAGSAGLSGAYDGTGGYALFNLPQSISVNGSTGYAYIADTGNNCIRRLTTSAAVSTVAGIAGISGNRSGPGDQALFNQPKGIAALLSALLVADSGNSTLRLVTLSSAGTSVSTLKLSLPTSTPTDSGSNGGTSSGGGGGAPSLWFLGLICLLGVGRYLRSKQV